MQPVSMESETPQQVDPLPTSKSLFEFLVSKRKELIELWMKRVRDDDRIESADELSRFVLQDHMPDVLMQIILALGRHKSGILSPEDAARLVGNSEASVAHASLRYLNGYTIDEAMRELSHLRGAAIELWHGEDLRPGDREIGVFHGCIDEVMAMAAKQIGARATASKNLFLEKLSHEIEAPLSIIKSQTEMLLNGTASSHPGKRTGEILDRQVKILSGTVRNLTNISKIIFGKLELKLTVCELGAVVATATKAIEKSAGEKAITLMSDLPAGSAPFLADQPKLIEALTNLLTNAVNFTPSGGRVSVMAEQLEQLIVITLADNGVGMSPEFLPLAFEQFRREANAKGDKGYGLGLAVARELVEAHGGEISAVSPGKNLGSKFTMSIPNRKVKTH